MQKYQSWDNPRCEILKALAKLKPMSRNICLTCKGGRLLCGRSYCPLSQIYQIQKPVVIKLKKEIFGPSPPSLFVGWYNYPNVFIGPLSSIDENLNAKTLDNPKQWYGLDFNDIIKMRSSLIRSKSIQNIKGKSKLVENIQELTLSLKTVDVELKFKKIPKYSLSFSPISQPMGPTGDLEKFSLTSNPKIPRKVDYIVNDELKAVEAASLLYKKGYDVYYLSKILSSGLLGLEKKLVPTRWSIVATFDMISKSLIEDIKQYKSVNEINVFESKYLENNFIVLLLPGKWEFENFETWYPGSFWSSSNETEIIEDYESFHGRTKYSVQSGGYYASRLGVCEGLKNIKRQGRVVVFREIYEGYVIPVGSWQILENVRHAFNQPSKKFTDMNEALKYIQIKLKIPLKKYLQKSKILMQKRLFDFF